MQDVEFTVEEGRLYLLQTRNAKRPPRPRCASPCDAVAEGLLDKGEALGDDRRRQARRAAASRPSTRRTSTRCSPAGSRPRPAPPRARSCSPPTRPSSAAADGEDVILVRPFTEAEDVARVRTPRAGSSPPREARPRTPRWWPGAWAGRASAAPPSSRSTSDQGVVHGRRARASRWRDDRDRRLDRGDHARRRAADRARDLRTSSARCSTGRTSCAGSGCGPTRTRPRTRRGPASSAPRGSASAAPSTCSSARTGTGWCRRCSSPPRSGGAPIARGRGRGPPRRRAGRPRSDSARRWQLRALQRADFEGIFHAMRGLPVTIRLLDPPLHEFLPRRALRGRAGGARARRRRAGRDRAGSSARWRWSATCTRRTRCWARGGSGSRSSIPQIYEMQVRAIIEAAAAARDEGEAPQVEIMLPLIAYETELEQVRELVVRAAEETRRGARRRGDLLGRARCSSCRGPAWSRG